MSVTVYTKSECPECKSTKQDLWLMGIPYTEVNVEENADALAHVTGLGFRSVPVIESDKGTWAGYDQAKLKTLVTYKK